MSQVKVLIGGEDFAEIRRENYYYVDKTDFLNKFFPLSAKVSLLTRPRRFGKTLFLSMLAEFFDITKDSCDLFAGLRVSAKEELCKERMNKYSVVFFSLKDVDGNWFSNALEDIQRIFSSVVIEHEYLLTSKTVNFADKDILERVKENRATDNELKNFLMILTRSMRYHHDKNVIVLLDEYDAPVAMAAEKGYYREMIHFMKGFFFLPP